MDEALRKKLIACMEAGTAARLVDIDHGENPHLVVLRRGTQPPETSILMERISAWWDGWEETHLALTPERAWREQTIYF